MRKAARIRAITTGLDRRCVVLVGMMGAGKSAIGRLLADELDLPYFDSDSEIAAAAGMSIPDIFEKYREVAAHGISVWLQADLDLLLARVMRRPDSRPLLRTPDPKATLAELLERRGPVYALADLHVESSRLSKKQTCDNVLKDLYAWLHRPAAAISREEKT
jgi:shikimate kinase